MMTKKQIEENLIGLFLSQQTLDGFVSDDISPEESGLYFRGVEEVRSFQGYLCTIDNGVVIDLADGTQICLIIQVR